MDFQKVSSHISSLSNWYKPLLSGKGLITVGIIIIISLFLLKDASLLTEASLPETSQSDVIKTYDINREFAFPLKDSQGKSIGSISYAIEKAELRNEIIVKGQRATAIPDHTFVILTIKITNDFKQAVQVNTRDYVRLSVNDTSEMVAPDIHNDPLEVQAISTKSTKVGFPISSSDKDLSLWVGELNAQKEHISISF